MTVRKHITFRHCEEQSNLNPLSEKGICFRGLRGSEGKLMKIFFTNNKY